jgi:hypothetical protein
MTYSISDFRRDIRLGKYAWPGGYPRYFVMNDGEALSFESAKTNRRLILESLRDQTNDGWRIMGVDINWEDPDLLCSDTNQRIEAAYVDRMD